MSTISKIFGCGLPTIHFNQECRPLTCTLTARLKFKYAPYNIAVHFIEVDLMGVDLVGSWSIGNWFSESWFCESWSCEPNSIDSRLTPLSMTELSTFASCLWDGEESPKYVVCCCTIYSKHSTGVKLAYNSMRALLQALMSSTKICGRDDVCLFTYYRQEESHHVHSKGW